MLVGSLAHNSNVCSDHALPGVEARGRHTASAASGHPEPRIAPGRDNAGARVVARVPSLSVLMRCPSCLDEYEPHIERCATCRVPLASDEDIEAAGGDVTADEDVPSGLRARSAAGASRVPDAPREVRLGTFEPVVAPAVRRRLDEDGHDYTVVEHDDHVEVLIDRDERDAVRGKLTVDWEELVEDLDEEVFERLGGGAAPGWFDAPQGGYIDRDGNLVVDRHDGDDEFESSRVLGPGMLVAGAAVGILGFWLLESGPLLVLGIIMVVIGLFSPR